jgi:hypothetical protein
MASPLMANTGASDLAIREPTQAEIERVLYLFRETALPTGSRLLVAVRARPIERFVAAAAWWPEETIGHFRLAGRPGAIRASAADLLIERVAECARRVGMGTLQYADLLPADHEWFEVLRRQGFEQLRSERSFAVAYRDAWNRVMRLHAKHQAEIPSAWHTDPIVQHPPELILDLIAPHRLLPPAQVRSCWRADVAGGFDLGLSCILFDGERPFGAFLARLIGEVIYIDVQVVQQSNPRLRSLGDLCLLYHDAQRVGPDGPIRWIRFRSGETEHRQTANLARRMGGRELPPRHVFGRSL